MTDNIHVLARAGGTLQQECVAEMDRLGLSRNAAAKRIGPGVSPPTLGLWLRGEYPGDVPAVEEKIRRWIDTEREAAKLSLAAAGLDVHRDLEVTGEVAGLLAHAQALGDIVLIYGLSGAGKSWAAERYCETHAAAFYIQMTRAVRSFSGLLELVSDAVGAGAWHPSALKAERAIIERLRDRGALLVIDEAHHLRAPLLDELRCIRDVAGCGLALMGDEGLTQTLARCPQIVGRIGGRLQKKKPSERDVAMLVSGVLGRPAARREIKAAMSAATGPGGLHALRRMLARAWMSARAARREEIGAEDLDRAAGVAQAAEAEPAAAGATA